MASPEHVRVQHLFSAPVLQVAWKQCEQLNSELRNLILAKRRSIPGVSMSNAGGWQSPKLLQTWDAECVQDLLNKINVAVYMTISELVGEEALTSLTSWKIAAWANVNEHGNYNMLHNHAGGLWSGVYYVDPGSPDAEHPYSGLLTLHNPTLAALASDNLRVPEPLRSLFASSYTIVPSSALMVVFPSWVQHSVHPYFGSTPRISVSWDVIFPRSAPPRADDGSAEL